MKTITPKEAQAMHTPDLEKWVPGVVREKTGGRFARFRAGELVLVRKDGRGKCTIQRRTWRGSMVPLANVCYGVPGKLVRYE